jgi:hypothetical protein
LEETMVFYILIHRFLDHLKWTKNEKDMGFENKEGFSSKTLRQNIKNVLFLLFMFSSLVLCFWYLEKNCNPSICTSNDMKIVIDVVKK